MATFNVALATMKSRPIQTPCGKGTIVVERGNSITKGTGTARRFERIRQDHAREAAEDYAELILDLGRGGSTVRPADLARGLGVTHVTVLRALDRLLRDGLITRDIDQGIRLSPEGLRVGEAARERHQLVVAFLEHLGVPADIANVDAEGIEHHVSHVVLDCMAAFIAGHPRRKG